MEIYTDVPKRFMKQFARAEPVAQDHSAVTQAHHCKRAYFYRIVLGFTEKKAPQFFGFGSCIHKFEDALEKKFIEADTAVRMTNEWQLNAFGDALVTARMLWKVKKMMDPPAGDKWDFLTQDRLVKSCATIFKAWQEEKKKGRIDVIATEQNFILPLPDGTKIGGKADKIIRWNGKPWGRDRKTSSKSQGPFYTRGLNPNDQFTRYTWAIQQLTGEPVQGILVAVLFNAKSTKKEQKGPELHEYMATRSPSEIEMWVDEQMWYSKNVLGRMREDDYYPMEPGYKCNFCIFHSVCKAGSERAQAAKLESEFKHEPWDCTDRADMDD